MEGCRVKKRCSWLLTVACVLAMFSGCHGQEATSTVYDRDGNPVAEVGLHSLPQDAHSAYADIVRDEAVAILAQINDCRAKEAEKTFQQNAYHIYTAYDARIGEAMQTALAEAGEYPLGCAMTDPEGNLLAAYSGDRNVNYAATRRAPYSAFKPLSVYMQAVESGKVHWSKMYIDEPFKQITDEDGTVQDWPQNATNTYSYQPTFVRDAVARSLNTVAVSCLMEVGVKESLDFMQSKLGMPVEAEQKLCEKYGEEELIGNVALGYLAEGLTPVEMAGYYQIFANGGMYTQPAAITKICDADGNVLYEREVTSSRVISAPTAQLMNRLLREVITPDGTGAEAALDSVQVAGKTGTGDGNTDNWFVGVTPHYSLAMWHGEHERNQSPAHFAAVMERVYEAIPQVNTNFITYAPLERVILCGESGQAIADGCTQSEIGYYVDGTAPAVCERHGYR